MLMKKKRRGLVAAYANRTALVILLSGALLGLWLHYSQSSLFSVAGFRQAVEGLGLFAPLLYIGLLTLSVVVSPLPSAPLAMVAGVIWGPLWAGFYSVIGGFLGGIIAYFIGYTLGRSTVKALTGKAIYFSKRRGEIFLGWVIFVTRLLPVLSFDLISYGAGMTGLSFPIYAIATLLGMIPSTFLLTYIGSIFTVDWPVAIVATNIFIAFLIIIPWKIKSHNWLGLKNIVRIR